MPGGLREAETDAGLSSFRTWSAQLKMRQYQFQEKHEAQWQLLEQLLDGLESGRRNKKPDAEQLRKLPGLYRDICQHLALAHDRRRFVGDRQPMDFPLLGHAGRLRPAYRL